MKQALIIVNRKSGTNDKKHIRSRIERQINKEQFAYELVFTEYKGHAIALSRQAVQDGLDLVIAAGGDGSVNEVARGLAGTDTALGILPLGSGNGLARSLQIPVNLSKALEVINGFRLKKIDAGYVNDRLFLSNAGVGFDAMVAKNFEDNRHRGFFHYVLTVIRTLSSHHPKAYELQVDGRTIRKEAFFIGIANGNQLGYNFKIAPGATLDDGVLDLCVIGPVPAWKLPFAAARSFNGSLPGSPYVEYFRGRQLSIRSEEEIDWMQTDGEAIAVDRKEIEIRVWPQALNVVTP